MHLKHRVWTLALVLGALGTLHGRQELLGQGNEDADAWLSRQLRDLVQARISQTSNTNQTEIPSLARSSSALIDRASASDLVGIGLDPLNLPKTESDQTERVANTITINPYLLYSALLTPQTPLTPSVYQRRLAEVLRKFSVTLGFEEVRPSDPDIAKRRATITGIKFLTWNRRGLTDAERQSLLTDLRLVGARFTDLR
jgi:hypothetical protein